ncbi:MAG TPA: hypothetical protein VNF47_21515 [Streptosporangiaceae bacterium]|nr:hypothetical protein [Streptosporangiaceae bacterium]
MAQDKHYYRTCRDPDCLRLPCVAYKTGYGDGYDDATAAAAEDPQ